ncbi:D-alanyl-D-alanine carboxypeptidase/D-alanyl-D-alanine-endopeptidase [Desulfospira joergensenii]|uniref:D-alanyl-D-alanine carboxypeptidase/D-alanyl-D-alanine-endopeptidase n=1 Tax=Desulfospira joergensenii TaxID=53329 RepID=UPI0003B6AE77|nr:D-alanyl-D-alanine carboxypeptidase [Desulfospira joergensenii]
MKRQTLFFILIFALIFPLVANSGTANPPTGILLTGDQGKILVSRNRNTPFIPASTLKIMTSLAAIHHFGSGFRFAMPAAYDTSSQNLYIRGLGDPLFVSEAIRDFTARLVEKTRIKEFRQVNDIILDLSFFKKEILIPGTGASLNPYDATTGALCANFNTLAFQWDPVKSVFLSAEPQTPLLDIFIKEIQSSGLKQGRILLDPGHRRIYPGLLIKFFLEQQGIEVRGRVRQGCFSPGKGQAFTYQSLFTMDQIIEKLLKFSNNFIANQLILTMGAQRYGEPASLEKGVKALEDFAIKELGLKKIGLAEGSGLSRKNRLTPAQMVRILDAFTPFHKLMSENQDEYYKTGTLTKVRCRAGYIKGKNEKLYPYVIMINGKNRGWKPILRKMIQKVRSVDESGD